MKRREDPAAYSRAWRAKNRDKTRAYHRAYYHKRRAIDPEFVKWHNLRAKWARRKKKYGITVSQYQEMLDKQKGRCQVCHQELGPDLRVDHDHKTGRIRSLLCSNCNSGIGFLGEDPSRLRAAANYLEAHLEKDERKQ